MTNPVWDGVTIDYTLLQNYGWYTSTVTAGDGQTYPRLVGYQVAGLREMDAKILAAGATLTSSSTTSLTIGTGSKSLTVGTNKAFAAGQFVNIAVTADATKYMFGPVTSYDISTGALVVSVSDTAGSGTYAAWTVSLVGPKGATGGATLPAGSASAPGLAVVSDSNTGIAQIGGADTLSEVVGGQELVRYASGVLTLNPGRAAINPKLLIQGPGANEDYSLQRDGASGYLVVNGLQTAASGFSFQVNNGSERLRVPNTGPVEIEATKFRGPATAKQATVAYASTITLDFAAQDYVIGDLTGPLTLANPSAYPVGQRGEILIHEDGTGGRTVSFGANWIKVGKDSINTAAGKYSVITYWVVASGVVIYSVAGGA